MAPSHCAFSNGFEFLEKFGVLEKKKYFEILKKCVLGQTKKIGVVPVTRPTLDLCCESGPFFHHL